MENIKERFMELFTPLFDELQNQISKDTSTELSSLTSKMTTHYDNVVNEICKEFKWNPNAVFGVEGFYKVSYDWYVKAVVFEEYQLFSKKLFEEYQKLN